MLLGLRLCADGVLSHGEEVLAYGLECFEPLLTYAMTVEEKVRQIMKPQLVDRTDEPKLAAICGNDGG